jgi:hypothetical protein
MSPSHEEQSGKVIKAVRRYCSLISTESYLCDTYLHSLHSSLVELYSCFTTLSKSPELPSSCDVDLLFHNYRIGKQGNVELCERIELILAQHGYHVTKYVPYAPDQNPYRQEAMVRYMEHDLHEIYEFLHPGAKAWDTVSDDERNAILNNWREMFDHTGMCILYGTIGCHNLIFFGSPKF